MKIFDPTILALPFFEDRHRQLAEELEAWADGEKNSSAESAGADVKERGRQLTRKLGEQGWLQYGVSAKTNDGPSKIDFRSICLIREAFSYVDDLVDFYFVIQALAAAPLLYYGNDTQKSTFLEELRTGKKIGAFAISEPGAGSDVSAISMTARKEGDSYILNGEKTWISNGSIADYYCLLARTGEGPGAMGLSCFIVPANTPGASVKEEIEFTAPRSFSSIAFNDCVIPAENLIGKSGGGFRYAIEILERYRMTVGAAAVGFSRKAMRASLEWSRSRKIGDGVLFDTQLTKEKLADMAVYLDAASLLVIRAAWELDNGKRNFSRYSSIAKVFATDNAQKVVDDAVQIFGAAGLVKNSVTEALYRQIRSLRIYEGTSEIQKFIISASLSSI